MKRNEKIAKQVITDLSEKIKSAFETSRKLRSNFYPHVAGIVLDYIIHKIKPSDLAEYQDYIKQNVPTKKD